MQYVYKVKTKKLSTIESTYIISEDNNEILFPEQENRDYLLMILDKNAQVIHLEVEWISIKKQISM